MERRPRVRTKAFGSHGDQKDWLMVGADAAHRLKLFGSSLSVDVVYSPHAQHRDCSVRNTDAESLVRQTLIAGLESEQGRLDGFYESFPEFR